jgi:dUTP pyrophosphatase
MILKVKKLHPDAIIPQYQTPGSVAFDLHSVADYNIMPGETKMVHFGIAVEVPQGYEMQIRQRSGISLEFPNYITICTGTIDQDYRVF